MASLENILNSVTPLPEATQVAPDAEDLTNLAVSTFNQAVTPTLVQDQVAPLALPGPSPLAQPGVATVDNPDFQGAQNELLQFLEANGLNPDDIPILLDQTVPEGFDQDEMNALLSAENGEALTEQEIAEAEQRGIAAARSGATLPLPPATGVGQPAPALSINPAAVPTPRAPLAVIPQAV